MFSFFKTDSTKKLKKAYLIKLEQAMNSQRNGKIRQYAVLTAEAERIREEIDEIESSH